MFQQARKPFALILALAILLSGVPSNAMQAGAGGGLCAHHAVHDASCGYRAATEEKACAHSHTPDCYSGPSPVSGGPEEIHCTHTAHDADCGYLEAVSGADCTFQCEVCNVKKKTAGAPVRDSGVPPAPASVLTGITVENEFGGPPPMAAGCTVPNGKLTVTPVLDGVGDAGAVTYQWYATGESNIAEGDNGTYRVTNPGSGTPLSETANFYVPKAADFQQYLYCVASLSGTSVASSAFRVVSHPALIGDLIIDYAANTISAPLENDGDGLGSAASYGANMASAGKIIIERGGGTIEEVSPSYADGLLSAVFSTRLDNLEDFQIGFFHASYFGALRDSGGKVPTDLILPGKPTVVVTFSAGGGNGVAELTERYVREVISKVAAANPGKKIVLVMRASGNTVNLSADILSAVADGDALYADIDSAKLTISKGLLSELGDRQSEIAITAEQARLPDNTGADAKAAIGGRPVVDLSITAGSSPVTDFTGAGSVTVSIPYSLADGEQADRLVVYYVRDDGTAELVTGASYANGYLTFTTDHFSRFAVGYSAVPGTCTVTFRSNGGNPVSPITGVRSGSTVTLPVPTRSGNYRFEGWYSGSLRYTSQTRITSDVILTASWSYLGGSDDRPSSRDKSSSRNSRSPAVSTPDIDTPSANVDSAAGSVKPGSVAEDAAAQVAAAVKAGQAPRANVLVRNASSVSPQALQGMADAARKAGGTAQLMADTTVNGSILVRLYLEASQAVSLKNEILLGASVDQRETETTSQLFEKTFGNKVSVIRLAHQGPIGMRIQVAVQVDPAAISALKPLYFYAYDKKTNLYYSITNPAYRIDQDGWLYFYTDRGGDIVYSNNPLPKQ